MKIPIMLLFRILQNVLSVDSKELEEILNNDVEITPDMVQLLIEGIKNSKEDPQVKAYYINELGGQP
jgi:hypothetical protein